MLFLKTDHFLYMWLFKLSPTGGLSLFSFSTIVISFFLNYCMSCLDMRWLRGGLLGCSVRFLIVWWNIEMSKSLTKYLPPCCSFSFWSLPPTKGRTSALHNMEHGTAEQAKLTCKHASTLRRVFSLFLHILLYCIRSLCHTILSLIWN